MRDMNEYNMCQTQLKELYKTERESASWAEFTAYRLLYYLVLQLNKVRVCVCTCVCLHRHMRTWRSYNTWHVSAVTLRAA